MKKFTLTLLLSVLFVGGSSGIAYADKHHNGNHDRGRNEYRDNRFGGRNDKFDGRHDNKNNGKNNNKHNSHKNPGNNKGLGYNPGWRPTPPPPPAPNFGHGHGHGYDIERHPNFHKMIAHAINGGTDYRVWRISHDTYIVKYRKGHRWYTRRFYPYANRYDAPGMININWNPMSAWTLLPSVNINIPIL